MYLALRYKFERISVGIASSFQLYLMYLTILEKKKTKNSHKNTVYKVQMELIANLLYFLVIICILAIFCVWYIFVILVTSTQEVMLKAYKLFVKAFKLLKEAVFGAH